MKQEEHSLLNAKHLLWNRPRDAFLFNGFDFVKNERSVNRVDIQQFMDNCGLHNLLEGKDTDLGTAVSQENSGLIDLAIGTVEFVMAS